MADIHIVTVGDKKKFKLGVRVILKAVAPHGTSDFEWLRNNTVLADAFTNQLFLNMGTDTAGYYTVRAKVGGVSQTSDAVRISIDDGTDDSGIGGSGAGAGAGASTAEGPPTYHSGFARISAVVIIMLGALLFAALAYLGSRVLSDPTWAGLEGRLKIAVVLGLPATIVGLVVVLVGLWMAAVEWRGRRKDPPVAVGNLRGAAVVMVVGAILMLGTAWVAASAAGTASAGGTSSPVAVPVRTPAPAPSAARTPAPTPT